METPGTQPYAASLDIDYPDRELSRLTSFFRIILVIPVGIILSLLSGVVGSHAEGNTDISAGGGLFLATLLMILFRQIYPRWWFDWQLALVQFSTRVEAYLCLMTDEYPALEKEQSVRVDLTYPDAKNDLNRWLPLVKWLLVLPHFIVLLVLSLICILSVIAAWFAILFTGRYPRGLFDYNVGVFRCWFRVIAYSWLLTTDQYPPFSLSA